MNTHSVQDAPLHQTHTSLYKTAFNGRRIPDSKGRLVSRDELNRAEIQRWRDYDNRKSASSCRLS